MKLERIDIYHFQQPFSIRFHSPQAMRIQADSLLLSLAFESGPTGWGECVPRDYVTGETLASVTRIIESVAAPLLFDAEIETTQDVRTLTDALARRVLSRRLGPHQCALAAVDIALLDALGHLSSMSVADVLSLPVQPKSILSSLSVPFLSEPIVRELFPKLCKQMDLKAAKVILGSDLTENVRRVRLIRELGGASLDLRVEANGKWSREEALDQLDALRPFRLSGIEQPLRPDDISGLQWFREKAGVPVIVDESLCSLEDAHMLIREQACDIFNIKVSKCGGLQASMEMVALAESSNIDCQVGTHVGESDILGKAAELLARNVIREDVRFDIGSRYLLSRLAPESAATEEVGEPASGFGLSRAYIESLKTASKRLASMGRGR